MTRKVKEKKVEPDINSLTTPVYYTDLLGNVDKESLKSSAKEETIKQLKKEYEDTKPIDANSISDLNSLKGDKFVITKKDAERIKLEKFHVYNTQGMSKKDIIQIMKLTNEEFEYYVIKSNDLSKRKAKSLDFYTTVGKTIEFYDQMKADILRIAINVNPEKEPIKKANLYLRAKSIETDKQEYLKTIGFYSIHKVLPVNLDEESSSTTKATLLSTSSINLLDFFSRGNDRPELLNIAVDDIDEDLLEGEEVLPE